MVWKKSLRLVRRHSADKEERGDRTIEMKPESSNFIFNMFRYIANMLMLMNGVGAITLINKDELAYRHGIIAFATGCLVSGLCYVFAYFAYCDMFFPNPDRKRTTATRYNAFKAANYSIMAAFIFSVIAFYSGIVLVFV